MLYVIRDGSNNRNADKQLNVSQENPFFVHKSNKIYALFDACHLIKSVRNALLGQPLEIASNKTARWQVLSELHELDRNNYTKLCPKLSDRHIFPNSFEKVNVKLATQVLSHSCSAAIKSVAEMGKFSMDCNSDALPTADFISKMDGLLDCLNSKIRYDRKPLRCALEKDNVHSTQIFAGDERFFKKYKTTEKA